jgi:hypothetical protein
MGMMVSARLVCIETFDPLISQLNSFSVDAHLVLISDGGTDYIVGDFIRGINAVDLTELSQIQDSRQQIDTLVLDLSVRLSTMGYDTAFYSYYISGASDYTEIPLIGCDEIVTNANSLALVTGDILTIMGRSYLGGMFSDPLVEIPTALQRLKDIELVLTELHLSLYEIHLDLLERGMAEVTAAETQGQMPLDSLKLGDDTILSQGADTIVGDSTTLFFQVDKEGVSGFEFVEVSKNVTNSLSTSLKGIADQRNTDTDTFVSSALTPSEPIRSSDIGE